MTTYTLAIGADMLLATVPDGDDIHAAVKAECAGHIDITDIRDNLTIVRGCTLTDSNDYDPEYHDLIWSSGDSGWIFDETGADWRYAIKP